MNYVLTNNLDKVSNSQAIYSLMCNEDGGVIDDLIVYRISSDEFFLCVNASNVENDFLHLDKFRKTFRLLCFERFQRLWINCSTRT